MLRDTHLHHCFVTAKASHTAFGDLFISPQNAAVIPTVSELSSRHPDLTSTQVDELLSAYAREATALTVNVTQFHLADWVARLLAQ